MKNVRPQIMFMFADAVDTIFSRSKINNENQNNICMWQSDMEEIVLEYSHILRITYCVVGCSYYTETFAFFAQPKNGGDLTAHPKKCTRSHLMHIEQPIEYCHSAYANGKSTVVELLTIKRYFRDPSINQRHPLNMPAEKKRNHYTAPKYRITRLN